VKLREIERLRAAAVLMVMAVHWTVDPSLLPEVARSSWSGVDLFFVISGYVVTLSLVRLMPPLEAAPSFLAALEQSRKALHTFYVRRFFRIMPAALAVMLVHYVLVSFMPDTFGPVREWWHEFFAFVGGVYNYARVYHDSWHLGPYWSLAVEEHFYLLLPMLFVLLRTTERRLAGCVVIALGSIAARHGTHEGIGPDQIHNYLKYASHLRFDSLMAGVALALLAGRTGAAPTIMPRWLLRWVILPLALVTVACLPGAAAVEVMERVGVIGLWMISSVLVAYAGLDRGYVLDIPVVGRLLEIIGARSYALYLVHLTAIRVETAAAGGWKAYARVIGGEGGRFHWTEPFIRCLLVAVFAEVLHRAVERPMMNVGKRVVERQGPAPSLPPAKRRARIAMGVAAGVLLLLVRSRHPILLAFAGRDLALGAVVTASSHMADKPPPSQLTNGMLEEELGLPTDEDEDPWALVDLGQPTDFASVRVYNRDDGYQRQDVPLDLEVSDDGKHFRSIAHTDIIFSQEWPWRIACPGTRARYVRLHLSHKGQLCLSEVEIFAAPWVARVP
jgi:peptidoglycan/LPS O-acetylase OafA/YrhL